MPRRRITALLSVILVGGPMLATPSAVLAANASHQYRFEATASGTTAVTDGASLRLDGTSQVKDQLSTRHGSPSSFNGTTFGTYESSVGVVNPVSVSEIAGVGSNSFFANLDNDNDEGIDLGDFDVGAGLTIEGWFFPKGSQADAYNSARLVSKRTSWQNGNFYAALNANGGVTFGVYTSSNYYEWYSSNSKVDWTKWNYIAIAWRKDSNKATFYIKPSGGSLWTETITNGSFAGTFANTSDTVSIGYNAGWDRGFEGYVDEVKLSDYAMRQNELSLQ